MYAGLDKVLPFAAPWDVPPDVRRSWLSRSDVRVAYVHEHEDASTFRYRVLNMVEALLVRPDLGVSASWFTRDDFRRDLSFVDEADVVVICRTRYDDALARLVERARGRGALVLFDVDDLVFDLSYVHFVTDALDERPMSETRWDYWFSVVGRLSATLDLCDGVLVTTPPLAERIGARAPGLPCAVLPNFLNRRQSEASAALVERKRATGSRQEAPLTVGYLSGSGTHNRDLNVASPAIAAAMARHPDLRLRIVGYVDLNDHLRPFAHRVEVLPLQDYLNLQRVTAECELCIAPLRLSTFSQCKSELKYFEAGAVGCPIVATPTHAFASAITDGVNGYLARAHEWHEKLEAACSLAASTADGLRKLSEAAREASLERYAWDAQAERIVAAIEALRSGA